MKTILDHIMNMFDEVHDPRQVGKIHYSLKDICFIALCTYISYGDSFYDMQEFATTRFDWLKSLIGLNKIPSHDTFNHIFQTILPADFQNILIDLAEQLRSVYQGDIIAFDGKVLRGTGGEYTRALQTLNVWSSKNHLALAQMAIKEKSNEITAIPTVMDSLELNGTIVTADALNTQKKIAAKVIEKKADYVFPVKENHPGMLKQIRSYFQNVMNENTAHTSTLEKGHGRLEKRECWQSEDLSWLEEAGEWKGIRSIGMVKSTRENILTGNKEEFIRYYISSLSYNPELLLECSRTHWEVENCLHWTLDVTFREDENRARAKNSAKNLAILRLISLNILKQYPDKCSLKAKRLKAGWNTDYLLSLLSGKVN